jgi:hypothetical protein
MSIRLLAFALLAGSSIAFAAPRGTQPPKAEPAPQQAPESIDVDAMARAKDVDAATDASTPAADEKDATGETPAADAAPAEPATAESPADANAPSQATPEEPPPDDSAPLQPMSAESSTDAASKTENTPAALEIPTEATPAAADAAPQAEAATEDASTAAATESDALQAVTAQPDTPQSDTAPPDAAERSIAAGCESRAAGLLDDAQKADYGNATRDFDAKMRSELPVPRFQQQWESLAQFGKLVARGQSHLGRGEGYTIVVIPLIFEKANLVAQIACGSDGRIAGFHVTQAPKPQF